LKFNPAAFEIRSGRQSAGCLCSLTVIIQPTEVMRIRITDGADMPEATRMAWQVGAKCNDDPTGSPRHSTISVSDKAASPDVVLTLREFRMRGLPDGQMRRPRPAARLQVPVQGSCARVRHVPGRQRRLRQRAGRSAASHECTAGRTQGDTAQETFGSRLLTIRIALDTGRRGGLAAEVSSSASISVSRIRARPIHLTFGIQLVPPGRPLRAVFTPRLMFRA
jgi:hypothetical protein